MTSEKYQEKEFTTVIKPRERLFEINLKEIWKYKDLMFLFVKRDITIQYKQTILGPLWYLIQPALTVIMYMVVFGGIAGISTGGIPQPLFYLSGICFWQYFVDCLNKTSSTFTANAGIFGKVYFPRLITPISVTMSNLVRFAVQLLLFFGAYVFYFLKGTDLNINCYALLFPVLVVFIAGLSFGFGVIISSMTTKYRDLTVLFGFITQLWMYVTPIVYPLSQAANMSVCGISMRTLLCLNPVTPLFEAFKYGFFGNGDFIGWNWLLYSAIVTVFVIFFGMLIFNRVQKTFMDTV